MQQMEALPLIAAKDIARQVVEAIPAGWLGIAGHAHFSREVRPVMSDFVLLSLLPDSVPWRVKLGRSLHATLKP